jgi:hypothetical protein
MTNYKAAWICPNDVLSRGNMRRSRCEKKVTRCVTKQCLVDCYDGTIFFSLSLETARCAVRWERGHLVSFKRTLVLCQRGSHDKHKSNYNCQRSDGRGCFDCTRIWNTNQTAAARRSSSCEDVLFTEDNTSMCRTGSAVLNLIGNALLILGKVIANAPLDCKRPKVNFTPAGLHPEEKRSEMGIATVSSCELKIADVLISPYM